MSSDTNKALETSKKNDLGVHFSSATDQWATPQDLFDTLNKIFKFETDVCASADNTKCANYFTEADNGLAQEWKGVCWMNPPYGRKIGDWMKKAYESKVNNGATVVCLVPARVDTKWWFDYCTKGEGFFYKGTIEVWKRNSCCAIPQRSCSL